MMKFLPKSMSVLILLSIVLSIADAHVSRGTPDCRPGYHRIKDCYVWNCCSPCPDGQFNDEHNVYKRCKPCRVCIAHDNFEYESNCSSTKNAQCKCKKDHYLNRANGICLSWKICAPGEGLSVPATFDTINECAACKEGQFSANYSYTLPCINHTVCGPCGVEKKGTKTSDTICAICPVVNSTQLFSASATTEASKESRVDDGTIAGIVIGFLYLLP